MGKRVGMWEKEWERCREMCLGVGPQHTSPHLLPHLTFPYICTYPLTSPTPQHTFLLLLSYLFPHLPFLPPHTNTFSYYSHISPHLLKVGRSFCGKLTVAKLPCGEVTGNLQIYPIGLATFVLYNRYLLICCKKR